MLPIGIQSNVRKLYDSRLPCMILKNGVGSMVPVPEKCQSISVFRSNALDHYAQLNWSMKFGALGPPCGSLGETYPKDVGRVVLMRC